MIIKRISLISCGALAVVAASFLINRYPTFLNLKLHPLILFFIYTIIIFSLFLLIDRLYFAGRGIDINQKESEGKLKPLTLKKKSLFSLVSVLFLIILFGGMLVFIVFVPFFWFPNLQKAFFKTDTTILFVTMPLLPFVAGIPFWFSSVFFIMLSLETAFPKLFKEYDFYSKIRLGKKTKKGELIKESKKGISLIKLSLYVFIFASILYLIGFNDFIHVKKDGVVISSLGIKKTYNWSKIKEVRLRGIMCSGKTSKLLFPCLSVIFTDNRVIDLVSNFRPFVKENEVLNFLKSIKDANIRLLVTKPNSEELKYLSGHFSPSIFEIKDIPK